MHFLKYSPLKPTDPKNLIIGRYYFCRGVAIPGHKLYGMDNAVVFGKGEVIYKILLRVKADKLICHISS